MAGQILLAARRAREIGAGDDPQQREEWILAHAPAIIRDRAKVIGERLERGGLERAAHRHLRFDRSERGLEVLGLQAAPCVPDQFAHEQPLGPVVVFVIVA